MKKLFVWMYVMAVVALAACGSDRGRARSSDRDDDDGGNTSGGNPNATPPAIPEGVEIEQLNSKDLGQLCDWYAELVGGYEQYECSDVTVLPTSGSQELCIKNAENNNSDCTSTVGMWILCAKKLAAVDLCEDGEFEAAQASPECGAYYNDTSPCFNIN